MLTWVKFGENQHPGEGRCSYVSERWDEALETPITLPSCSRQDLVHAKVNEPPLTARPWVSFCPDKTVYAYIKRSLLSDPNFHPVLYYLNTTFPIQPSKNSSSSGKMGGISVIFVPRIHVSNELACFWEIPDCVEKGDLVDRVFLKF